MKCLVTGGAGFIGSHLVDRLLKVGHEVTVIDNFCKGKRENLPIHPNLKVCHADIFDVITQEFSGMDIVFHLAALTRPQESIENPQDTSNVNIMGTLKVFTHCAKYNIPKVIFMSTTGLYGTQELIPTPETASPHPMSPYALTKLVGEEYGKLFARLHQLNINYIRPFNVYGPRQNPKGSYAAVVPTFIDQLSKDQTPSITGDGNQSRDFIYVDDIVELLMKAALTTTSGEVFNGGSGTTTPINTLYALIAKLLGKNIDPIYIPAVFEPPVTQGDISKAREMLGWEPRVSLEDGLRMTINANLKVG